MAADKIFSRSSKRSLQMFIQQICRLQSRQREIVEHSNIIYNRQKETTWLEFGSKKNWEEFLAKLKKSIFNFFLAFCSFSLEQQQPSLDVEQRRLRNKKILAERVWLTSGPGTMTTFGTYILILRDLRGCHELGYVARLEDINLRLFAISYNYTVVK